MLDIEPKFTIENSEPISASSLKALIKKIEEERDYWLPLIPKLGSWALPLIVLEPDYRLLLDELENISTLPSEDQTSRLSVLGRRQIFPASTSGPGILLRGLLDRDEIISAGNLVFAYFHENGRISDTMLRESKGRSPGDAEVETRLASGRTLLAISRVADLESHLNTKTKRLELTEDQLRSRIDDLDQLFEKAEKEFEDHKELQLAEWDSDRKHIKRLERLYAKWFDQTQTKADTSQENWNKKFKNTHQHYVEQLQFKAPVELWKSRMEAHGKKAHWGLVRFLSLVVVCAIGISATLYFGGDYIANSFTADRCSQAIPNDCRQVFSPKGIFTTSSVLLILSLMLWVLRLQSKVYLSERHLYLDAEEKKAFTETYLALLESGSAARDHEAIVLATLFRPTQDGIVKDDDSGLDVSALAMLSKQLSKPN
jgi:hypothetical protein